jgi:hypothetical protein
VPSPFVPRAAWFGVDRPMPDGNRRESEDKFDSADAYMERGVSFGSYMERGVSCGCNIDRGVSCGCRPPDDPPRLASYSPGVRSFGMAGLCPLPSAPTGAATTSPSTSIAPCTLSNGSASTTCSAGLINGCDAIVCYTTSNSKL